MYYIFLKVKKNIYKNIYRKNKIHIWKENKKLRYKNMFYVLVEAVKRNRPRYGTYIIAPHVQYQLKTSKSIIGSFPFE
jgi:hypothetical protein